MKDFDKYRTISPDYHYRRLDPSSLRDFSAPMRARFDDLMNKVASATRGTGKLLDVGCGDGVALFLLRKRFPKLELFGIDPMSEAITIAKEKVPNAHLEQGTADKLPFESDFFDLVISSDVIEHVSDADLMLREMKRVAQPEAAIIIGTPIKLTKNPLDHNHAQEFFPEDFMSMVARHFREPKLFESHHLGYMLFYNAPTRSFFNFKYLINLLFWIFGWNPFRRGRQNKIELFAYQTVVCKK